MRESQESRGGSSFPIFLLDICPLLNQRKQFCYSQLLLPLLFSVELLLSYQTTFFIIYAQSITRAILFLELNSCWRIRAYLCFQNLLSQWHELLPAAGAPGCFPRRDVPHLPVVCRYSDGRAVFVWGFLARALTQMQRPIFAHSINWSMETL